MALDHSFLVFDLQVGATGDMLTHGQVLAMLDGHPDARWIVIRRQRDGRTIHYACPRETLHSVALAPTVDKRFGATLTGSFSPAATLDRLQYRSSALQPAVVLDDGVPVGVTVPWGLATRGAAPSRGVDGETRCQEQPTGPATGAADLDAPDGVGGHGEEFPHRLDALMPARVPVNGSATLVVTLDRIHRVLATAGDVLMRVGEPLDITVQGDSHLQPVGENSQPLAVPAAEDSCSVRFTFAAKAVGEACVKVFAFRGARSVARLVLPVKVMAEHADLKPNVKVRDDTPFGEAGSALQPELCLLVMEGKDELRFQLWANGQKVSDYGPVIARDMTQYSRLFADSIEGLAIGKPDSAKIARAKLEAWGSGLFQDLIPPALQTLLADKRDAITIQICSDEAWIPWEACRLLRYGKDGHVEEGQFFAEAFAMTRWLHGTPAPDRFRMSRCALVVPSGSGLDTADAERAYYLGLERAGCVVEEIAARYLPLTQAMASGAFDAWHFCGHANAGAPQQGDRATLRLQGNETMSADLFAGTVENALTPRPFIFFNACQSAMGGQSLTGAGGWAHRFIRPPRGRHGAAAFIGTYWSVYDAAAHRFAKALYTGLREGQAIGAAVREARRHARADETTEADPLSWLAYTVYANPLAVLETP